MTLLLDVAAGYVLGRVVCHLGNVMLKVLIRQWLERSPRWRALVRRSTARDAVLQATLVGPWVSSRKK